MIILGIDDLRYKANILHCNISEEKIVCTQTKEGKDWFILIDFDLGVKVTKEGFPLGPSARHHTGTLPFMAYELVGSLQSPIFTQNEAKSHVVQHCIRHDFESLFWVSLRCATSLVDPKLSKSAPTSTVRDAWLTEFEKGDPRSIPRRTS